MSERETGYAPDQTELHEQSDRRKGVLRKFDDLYRRYPKITKTLLALQGAFTLSLATEGVFGRIELPAVQRPKREITITQDDLGLIKELEGEVGDAVDWVLRRQSITRPEDRPEVAGLPSKLRVNGFEKFNISNETVQGIIEKTLPRGFARNVSSISYRDYDAPMTLRYGTKLMQSSREAGHASSAERRIEIVK